MDEEHDFKTFFAERLKARGYTLRKLSEISGIALDHLENLAEGRYDELPPAPYLRGYLERIGELLAFDPNPWWEQLKQGSAAQRPGPTDALPVNRFAPRPVTRYVWAAVVIAIVIGYLVVRLPKILGRPDLAVTAPAAATVTVSEPAFTLQGHLGNGDRVFVNGEPVTVASDGSWHYQLPLEPHLNTVTVSAKKFLGGETSITRQIIYEPPTATSTGQAPASPVPATTSTPGR
jgi:hypothetical protein